MSGNNDLKYSFEGILKDLALKLSSYEYICKVSSSKNSNIRGMNCSISDGLASLCIFFAELNKIYPNIGYDKVAHKYLSLIVKFLNKSNNTNLSLWGGLCGIGLAAVCMSNNFLRYNSFLKSVNDVIVSFVDEKLKFLKTVPELKEEYYDVMYGLSGIANYHMLFLNSQEMIIRLKLIVEYFISLCKDKLIDNRYYPGFTLDTTSSIFIQNKQSKYYINLGLSHGITGILLVLVKSYMKGICLNGHVQAIKYLKDIILNNYIVNATNRKYWPASVRFYNNSNKMMYEEGYTRDAWCYGTPGVAYVMLKTSDMLDDKYLRTIATNAMLDSLKYQDGAISPTFCHGYAGLLYLANKFYMSTKFAKFKVCQEKLVHKILAFYDSKNIFGFKDIDIVNSEKCYIDDFGLLSGSIGIMLSLMAIYYERKTPWDVAFLLDEY